LYANRPLYSDFDRAIFPTRTVAMSELETNLKLAQLFEQNRLHKAGARALRGGTDMGGFKNFILRGNVVDMAVGIVVGAAFGTVVTAFVKDLLTPFIAAIVKQPDFSAIAFNINGSKFLIGEFINALIAFLLIATAVYFGIVMPINKLLASTEKPAAPTTQPCPECLSEIPIKARRCSHCTSPLQT
jgi:large conductance mechanosensitive channel